MMRLSDYTQVIARVCLPQRRFHRGRLRFQSLSHDKQVGASIMAKTTN